jgi:hypothetical protein
MSRPRLSSLGIWFVVWVSAILMANWFWTLREQLDLLLAAIWTVVTGLGMVITLWTWMDATRERGALKGYQRSDPVLTSIADANVRREVLRTLELLALFVIGLGVVTAMSNPLVTRTLLILVAVLLVANSALDRWERRQTARILRTALREPIDPESSQQSSP